MKGLQDNFQFETGDTLEDNFATGEITHRYWDVDHMIPLYRIAWKFPSGDVDIAINAQDELDEYHD